MQTKQESLFSEVAYQKPVTELRIQKQRDRKLSKNQQDFNRLTKKITTLQNKIATEKEKLEFLLKTYSESILVLDTKIAGKQIELAKKIDKSTETIKYGPRQIENVGKTIVYLCNDAFYTIEPDKKTQDLYDKWAENTYEEEIQAQEEENLNMMSDMFSFMTGMDVDFSKFKDAPEEEFENLKNEFEAEFEERQAFFNNPGGEKKKTKKQLEKELNEKKEQASKLKSIRNIYLSLAKVLHPDKENDDAEKLKKEDLMKKVTEAYGKKDLPALLKLEMEWVASESNNIQNLGDEKLKLYIMSLKEQVRELEEEFYQLEYDPRYESISDISCYTKNQGVKQIDNLKGMRKQRIESIDFYLNAFSLDNPKKSIMAFVNETVDIMKERETGLLGHNDFSFFDFDEEDDDDYFF